MVGVIVDNCLELLINKYVVTMVAVALKWWAKVTEVMIICGYSGDQLWSVVVTS